LAMADHDQQTRHIGHSTTGEAGGTCVESQKGRNVVADPPSETRLPPVRSGRYVELSPRACNDLVVRV